MKEFKSILMGLLLILLLPQIAIAEEVVFSTGLIQEGKLDPNMVFHVERNASFDRYYEFKMNVNTESKNQKDYEVNLILLNNYKQVKFLADNKNDFNYCFRVKPNQSVTFPISINCFQNSGMHDLQFIYFFASDFHQEDRWDFRVNNPFDMLRLTFYVNKSDNIPSIKQNNYTSRPAKDTSFNVSISKSDNEEAWINENQYPYLERIKPNQNDLNFYIHLSNGKSQLANLRVALICLLNWRQTPMNGEDVVFVSLPACEQMNIPVSIPLNSGDKKYSDLVVLAIAAPFEPIFLSGTNFQNGNYNKDAFINSCSPRILLVIE